MKPDKLFTTVSISFLRQINFEPGFLIPNSMYDYGKPRGKEIYRTTDQWGDIVVTEHHGYRRLFFDTGFEQSSILMSKPQKLVHEYTQTMMLVLLFIKPERVSLLGLGAGSLVQFLYHYYQELSIDAVELRQAVIDIAGSYFNLPCDERVKIINTDAQLYLDSMDNHNVDIIFSDLYEATGMNKLQSTLDFVSSCYHKLQSNGWLVINYHNFLSYENEPMQRIRSLFKSIYQCKVSEGNWILFCGKSETEMSREELKITACDLEQTIDHPFAYHMKNLLKYRL